MTESIHTSIPLAVPCLRGREAALIKECLDTNWVSYAGPFVDQFERALASTVGASHAVATSSGTAALHIALLLAGVGRDDEVVMPGLTFVAPANAIRYCSAWPLLTDIRPDDWQWDVDQVAHFLSTQCQRRGKSLVNKQSGRRIACLMPVHLLGGMCDVDAVVALANQYELPIVEDAAECMGATRQGRMLGAPHPAYRGPLRLVITSFNGNKIITTGGGGAIFSEDAQVARHAKHLTTTAKADPVEFYHDEVGFNYRLTSLAAAMGIAQLEQLHGHVESKRRIAASYSDAFGKLSSVRQVHPEPVGCHSTFWMYTIIVNRPSRPIIDRLNARGIMSRPLWQPLNRLPAFSGECGANLSCADELYEHGISLPCSVGLTRAEQDRVMAEVTAALDL